MPGPLAGLGREGPLLWNEASVELLLKLWKEGLPCTALARQLNKTLGTSFSRNAVIGKVHRMGIQDRGAPTKPDKGSAVPRSTKPVKRPPVYALPKPAIVAPANPHVSRHVDAGPGSATIHTLRAGECKWPIGDPQSSDFTFCGAASSKTYCPVHHPIAYKAGTAMKDRNLKGNVRRYA